jgi:hypothetical protein
MTVTASVKAAMIAAARRAVSVRRSSAERSRLGAIRSLLGIALA